MTIAICTIVTADHFHRAVTLFESVRRTNSDAQCFVLVVDGHCDAPANIETISLEEVTQRAHSAATVVAMYGHDRDRLRWCLKPPLMKFILQAHNHRAVVYADADTYFVRRPEVMVDILGEGGVLLTPHWRPLDPTNSNRNFRLNFMDGLYNAGCVVATRAGIPALDWWSDACIGACEQNRAEGLWDDQRYLDLVPIYFDNTVVCRDRGFNLADWNAHLREPRPDGKRDVPDRWPVGMIHFTRKTVLRIESGDDPILAPHLEEYRRITAEAELRFF